MQNDAPMSALAAPKGLKQAAVAAAIIAVAVVGFGTFSRFNETAQAQQSSDARSIPTVHLVPVEQGTSTNALALPGTMQAWTSAKLYARVGGYLKSWSRDIGAHVSASTPLGQIDTPELDQQIVQARADLASAQANAGLARTTAARWNDLLTTHSVSQQEADEKNGNWQARRAAVQSAQANLGRLLALKSFATVRAPFAGVVTMRAADIGDLVGPGAAVQQPIFAVADIHRIRIYASVPQAYSAVMKPGLGATLTVPDYPGRHFAAQIIGSSGAVDSQGGTMQVQLVADNPDGALKPGGYAQVAFDATAQASAVLIPSSALIFRAQGTQVALIGPNGHAHLQRVAVGRDMGQTVEITSGLNSGEHIVDNPPDSLGEGELVRVQAATHG